MKNNKIISFAKTVLELSKVKITIAVSFTTFTGYVVAKHNIDTGVIAPIIGIFLLACGASAINHVQEYSTDAKMERTKKRPIPSGRISRKNALLVALTEILAGTFILWYTTGLTTTLLGWLALFWYNGVYTPLKKITPSAVIPGSLIGAIPPLVGWVAGGESLLNPQGWFLSFFFFIWQVPHFYLLMLKYGKQYENAGFPSLTAVYSEKIIRIIIFLWIIVTSAAAVFLPYFGLFSSIYTNMALIIGIIWLDISFLLPIVRSNMIFRPFRYFMKINYFVLFIMILLTLDNLLFI